MTGGEMLILAVIAWLFYALHCEGRNAEQRHQELMARLDRGFHDQRMRGFYELRGSETD